MLENLTKWVGDFVPFIAPYPTWVKLAFSVFVLSGATCFIGLILAAPSPTRTAEITSSIPPDTAARTAWMTITGITGYGRLKGAGVRVTATVNGTEYIYPSLPGVDWLQIGPEMAPQTFQIPVRDVYAVRFSANVRDGTELVSVQEQYVQGSTSGIMTYGVHELDQGQRNAPVSADINYKISQNKP